MSVEIQPYFAEGERYPALIGVRAEGDEYETAYVSKSELVDALAENAKLRELIADIHESLKADKAGMFHNLTLSAMEDDMRELGVEVYE